MTHIHSESGHVMLESKKPEKITGDRKPDKLVTNGFVRTTVSRLERLRAVEEAVENGYITPLVRRLFVDDMSSIERAKKEAGIDGFSDGILEMLRG